MYLADLMWSLKTDGDLWMGFLFTRLNLGVKLTFRNSVQLLTCSMEA